MDRRLALAYLISTTAIASIIFGARFVAPHIEREVASALAGLISLALLASAYLFFAGAGRSVGSLRKILAYGLSVVMVFAGASLAIGVALVAGGVTNAA